MANGMANGLMTDKQRRTYGSGAMYQRTSDWRWIATTGEDTWTDAGTRKRTVVTGKGCAGGCAPRCSHRAAIKSKLADKVSAIDRGEVGANGRETVKGWAKKYLEIRVRDLAPKAYNAAASPIQKWVIPTIGHRRLDQLTPGDIRAVADAQRSAGRKAATQAATQRALKTMLRHAVMEGHAVPSHVLEVKAPTAAVSDRASMTIEQGLACIEVASGMPNGVRWLFTLLYGQRMGECLGLTWDAVDFGAPPFGEVVIEWQLQALPYITPRDRSSGFRVPDGHESRHLVDAYHLVRPKSRAGYRVAPLLAPVRDAMLAWQASAPPSPHGLVWPEPNGRPRNDKHDRAEWWALQRAAGVHHPTRTLKVDGERVPAPYHVHECRNFAATMLLEAGVPEHVITDLLGHSTLVTSLKYRTRRREPLLDAMMKVGQRLGLESASGNGSHAGLSADSKSGTLPSS